MQIIKSLRKYDLALIAASVVIFAVLEVLIDMRLISSFWRLQIILIGINIILAASQRHHRPVLSGPCRIHGGRRLRLRHHEHVV